MTLLVPILFSQAPTVTQTAERIVASSGRTRIEVSLKDGRYNLAWEGGTRVNHATSNVRLADGRERCASDFATHRAEVSDVADALGKGVKIDVHHRKEGEPELVTTFWLYANRPETVIQVSAISPTPISTDRMLPIIADGGVELSEGDAPEVLFVPFNNDAWVRYHSKNWSDDGESYEVGAAYDNRTRKGLVVGSLDHDTWKSAVQFRGRNGRKFAKMYAYAGATGHWTQDREPHGSIRGTTLRSPRMAIGAFDDWRDGMESFARANGALRPPLPWTGGTPLGWNSWSAVKMGIDEPVAVAAAGTIQQIGFRYVNLDAGWTNIPDLEIPKFVARIHAMGLKVGIYGSPFSAWQQNMDDKVEGTDGRYTLRDIILKDRNGNPFPRISSGWPVDPTHPGVRQRNAWTFARFKEWGFDYIKLDFVHHGALEGRHYDPAVTTGMQAYNFGMKEVVKGLKGMFISLSIAPMFPHEYAHSRRISCDAFSDIGQSEYMLNSATYGWWSQGPLYPYNDPDHTVVYQTSGESPVSEAEGRTRITASIVGGGMLLNGDDLRNPAARERVMRLFTNGEVLALAKKGLAFRPLEGDTGEKAATAFVLKDGKTVYVAAFNYDREGPKLTRIDFNRAGIGAGPWRSTELWEGSTSVLKEALTVKLEPKACTLLKLTSP